jgi:hypothetical protein
MLSFKVLAAQATRLLFLLEVYAVLSTGSPITSESLDISPSIERRTPNMDNLDILLHDGNGTLVRPSQDQRRDMLDKRQNPGQVTYVGDGQCRYAKQADGNTCVLFCNAQTSIVNGSPQTVSADVDCTVNTCSTAHAYSVTVTDTNSISLTIQVKYAKNGIEGQAQLGYSHTWSTAVSTTNTYTFAPSNGDKGHVIFVPYMEEACGSLTTFEFSGEYYECLDYTNNRRDGVNYNHVLGYSPMSCGQTGIKLQDGSANGVCIHLFLNSHTMSDKDCAGILVLQH